MLDTVGSNGKPVLPDWKRPGMSDASKARLAARV